MFERYTEKARRVIFFARYEASQFGSPYIETEHLLLGLLREDKALTNRFLRSHASVESIRKQIEGHTTIREKVSTSVDLPCRTSASACWPMRRKKRSGCRTSTLAPSICCWACCAKRNALPQRSCTSAGCVCSPFARNWRGPRRRRRRLQRQNRESSLLAEFSRDLTQAAMDNQLDPLVGRDSGTGARGADPVPPHQEQSGADRRAGRGQDGHCRRAGAAHLPTARCPASWPTSGCWRWICR